MTYRWSARYETEGVDGFLQYEQNGRGKLSRVILGHAGRRTFRHDAGRNVRNGFGGRRQFRAVSVEKRLSAFEDQRVIQIDRPGFVDLV